MIDLEINSNNDLVIENYDLQLVNNEEQLIQNLAIRLKFFTSDWFLDITAGIPYYEEIFIKSPNQIRIESIIKQEILDTDGINEITSFSSTFDNTLRKFTVNFSATTDTSEFELEVSVP